MKKCLDCGCVFEELAEWTEPHGEIMHGCPNCHVGEIVEAGTCRGCFEVFAESELYGGYCKNCLRDRIDYDNALAYLIENDYLADFMFCMIWNMDGETPSNVSVEFSLELQEIYKRKVADEKLMNAFVKNPRYEFLEALKNYLLEDSYTTDDFGNWLEGRKK